METEANQPHPKEIEARWRKASRLAAYLHNRDIKACQAHKMGAVEWMSLGRIVGVNTPSETTIAVVQQILADLEAAEARRHAEAGDVPFDPFKGFGF